MARSTTRRAAFGSDDLDRGDLAAGPLLPDRVHQPGRLEREQPGLFDLDAGLGDPLADDALLGERLAERRRADTLVDTSGQALARPCRCSACSDGCDRGQDGPGRSRSRRPPRR